MNIKKVLKKTGKILLITLLSVLFLIVVLVVVAFNSENLITQMALKEVSLIVKAPVKVDHVSLRLFRHFPQATVEFSGFTVGKEFDRVDSANFEIADTLVRLRKLYISLKSRPLLQNKVEIDKIEVEGFMVNYFVDSTGATNFDFLMAADSTVVTDSLQVAEPMPIDTSETMLNVLLADLTIRDVLINYDDRSLKAAAKIHVPKIQIEGKVNGDHYSGMIKGSVALSGVSFDGTNAHLLQKMNLGFHMGYDNGAVNIKSLELSTDGAKITAKGKANLADSIAVDMVVNFSDFDLKELIKYAPADMLKEFGISGVEGKLDIETNIKGYVYDTLLLPSVNAKISFKNGLVKTTEYPLIQKINISGTVNVENPNDLRTVSADFRNFSFATNKSTFTIACKAKDLEKIRYELSAKANLLLDEFSPFLPDSTAEYISGRILLDFQTHGILPDDIGINSADYFMTRTKLNVKVRNLSTALDSVNVIKNLSLDFDYQPNKKLSVKNFSVSAPGYGVELSPSFVLLQLVGNVADFDNLGINIDAFNFAMGSNSLSGKATLKGLNKPTFTLESNVKVDLTEIRSFIPDSLVEYISGKVEMNIHSYGTVDLDSIDACINPIAFEQTRLDVKFRDFNFEMFGDTLAKVKNMNLDFAMADDTIRIDNFYANLHGIETWIDSTQIWNVYKTFLLEQKDKQLIVKTHIRASDFDYAKFAHLIEEDTTAVSNAGQAAIPGSPASGGTADGQKADPKTVPQTEVQKSAMATSEAVVQPVDSSETYIPPYIVYGTFAMGSVKYGDILLKNLSTKFRVDDSLYVVDKFRFEGFGGSMVTSAVYDTRNPQSTVVMFKNEIDKMNIKQLLIDANNFDQTDFTHENISGILTSSVDGRIVMQGDSVIYDKIIVRGRFKLENGGIYNYEPLRELGKFTNLRELDNVVFRTMESGVFIYENGIYFPKTDIVSTAIDMSAFGMVSFGDDYQLHLKVFLNDVLVGKSDKLLKAQGKESDLFDGKDEKSRRGLNLLALNRKGETKYGFDNKRMQRIMTAEIRVQETGLGLLFNPKLINYSTELNRREIKKRREEPANE
jgi:hypothetical protein